MSSDLLNALSPLLYAPSLSSPCLLPPPPHPAPPHNSSRLPCSPCIACQLGSLTHASHCVSPSSYLLPISYSQDLMRVRGDLPAGIEADYMCRVAQIHMERGTLAEAGKMLTDLSSLKGMPEELYLAGCGLLVEVLVTLKAYTKAEMQCR